MSLGFATFSWNRWPNCCAWKGDGSFPHSICNRNSKKKKWNWEIEKQFLKKSSFGFGLWIIVSKCLKLKRGNEKGKREEEKIHVDANERFQKLREFSFCQINASFFENLSGGFNHFGYLTTKIKIKSESWTSKRGKRKN